MIDRQLKAQTNRPIDPLKLSMVPRDKVAHSAILALHQLQDLEDPEHMMLGVATLFASFCRRARVDASELHAMGLNVIDAPVDYDMNTGGAIEMLRDFAGMRIAGQEVTIS